MGLDGGDILFYAGITLLAFISLLFLKKLFFRLWLQRNYLMFPSLDINTISSIAMIIATNTAIIFAIIFLTHNLLGIIFQVYPGSRLLIETILIKIGGSLYGPSIGMLIGLLTDLLTVILTSSVFNYGYLLAAIFNGFLGGFIFIFLKDNKLRKKFSIGFNSLLVSLLLIVTCVLFYFFQQIHLSEKNGNNNNNQISLNIFSKSISFPLWSFPVFLISLSVISLGGLALSLLFFYKNSEDKNKKSYRVNSIFRLISINLIAYIFVDIITLPLFDIKISTLPYEQFFIMRNFFLIPSVSFSSFIIWKIFKLNHKLEFISGKNKLPPLPILAKPNSLLFKCNEHLRY